MARRVLGGVAPFRFAEGRDCTFVATLAVATKGDYDWLMGCSGAAFDLAIDAERWDPLAATVRDTDTMARAARAAGVRLDPVAPPYDEELRELVLARIAESIDAHAPPLVRGLAGPPEFGLIIGYDEAGPTFFARTFFDKGPDPARVGWEAFVDEERGTPVFLDPAPAADPLRAALEGIDAGLAAADAVASAYATWAGSLRDEARWTDRAHAGSAAFGDHAVRGLLVDKRRAAARFLRQLRARLSASPGADLLRAAESYGYVAEAAARGGTGPFDAAVALRFLDPGQRRAWAKALDEALRHEREAHAALRSARDGAR
ncbi:MAG: hypothetical protein ACRDF0_09520 [Candidatus Limnocylindria bacterium]